MSGPSDAVRLATPHMIAVLTLTLDGATQEAARYISSLPRREVDCMAAVCCTNIVELIRDTAAEHDMAADDLLRAVAMRAALMAT